MSSSATYKLLISPLLSGKGACAAIQCLTASISMASASCSSPPWIMISASSLPGVLNWAVENTPRLNSWQAFNFNFEIEEKTRIIIQFSFVACYLQTMFFYAPGLFIVMLEPVLVLVSFSLSPLRPMRAGTHVFGTLINLILKLPGVQLLSRTPTCWMEFKFHCLRLFQMLIGKHWKRN